MRISLVRACVLAVAFAAMTCAALVVLAGPASARDDVHLVSKLVPANAGGPYTGAKRSDHNTHEVFDQARKTSADGRYVVFVSEAPDLIANQSGTQEFAPQVFLRDRVSGTTTLVSHSSSSATTASNGRCEAPGISSDGLWVSFSCESTNLVANQVDPPLPPPPPNNPPQPPRPDMDMFLWSRTANTNVVISKKAGATAVTTGDGDSRFASINASGQYIVYRSQAPGLVSGYVNGHGSDGADIYLYDRVAGTNRLVSHIPGAPATSPNGRNDAPVISDDGNLVVFESRGSNLIASQSDAGGDDDVFLWNRTADVTTLVSRQAGSATTAGNGSSQIARLSADGTKVVFETLATNLVAGVTDANAVQDIYVFTVAGATMQLASRSATSATTTANNISEFAQISGNGLWIAFQSWATNLVPSQTDANNKNDVFAFNTTTGTARLLSAVAGSSTTTNQGTYSFAELTSLSSTGQFIVFSASGSNIIATVTDTNGGSHTAIGDDVFLHDTTANTTKLVSRRASSATQTAAGASHYPYITPNGALVLFRSTAHDIVAVNDTNADFDVYAYDRAAATNSLVSIAGGSIVNVAGGTEGATSASDDGRYVAFTSKAPALIANQIDHNGALDVFLYDTTTRTNTLVSHRPGLPTWASDGEAYAPVVSGDGNWVAFTSSSRNLVSGFTSASPEVRNIYLFNRATGVVTLVSHAVGSNSTGGNNLADWPSISDDGARVAFGASGTNIVNNQGEAADDIDYDAFVWTRATNTNVLASHEPDGTAPGTSAFQLERSEGMRISGNGGVVLFGSGATTFGHTDDTTGGFDFFTYNVSTGAVKLVSHNGDGQTVRPGQRSPYNTDISDNGQRISWHNFGSGQGGIWLYDSAKAVASQLTQITASNDSFGENEISGDGSIVAFRSTGAPVPGSVDSNGVADMFVYDVATATTKLASHTASNNLQAGNEEVGQFNLSTNGKYLAFASEATNYVTGVTDPAGTFDVFMYELATNKVVFPISRHFSSDTVTAGLAEQEPTMSDGGHVVTFISRANGLVNGDNNLSRDAYSSCFPELSVSADRELATVFAGDLNTVEQKVIVTNSGPCFASEIKLNLTRFVPAGVTFTPYLLGGGTMSGNVWTIPALEPGATVEAVTTYTVGAATTHASTIATSAEVVSLRQLRLSAFDDSATTATTVHNLPIDLVVLFTQSPAQAVAGQPVTITGTIQNNTSGVTATNVHMNVFPTAGTGVTWATPTVSGGTLNGTDWSVGSLAPKQSRTVAVTFTVPSTTAAGAQAAVRMAVASADQRRDLTTNDDVTRTATIVRVADVRVVHTISAPTFVAGSGVQMVITTEVRNFGPSATSGVSAALSTSVPPGVQALHKAVPPGATLIEETWNVGILGNNAKKTLARTYNIPSDATPGQVTSSAAASIAATLTSDPDATNNSANAAAAVVRQVALVVTQEISAAGITAGIGVPIVVTTRIENTGPSDASDIVVGMSGTFPAGVPEPTVDDPPDTTFADDEWAVPDLPPATPLTLTQTYDIPSSAKKGPITTEAVVTAYAEAPNPLPVISDSTTSNVSRLTDIVMTMTESADPVYAGGPLTYVMTAENVGPSDVDSLKAAAFVSAPEGFVTTYTPELPGSYTDGVWSIGTLASGASRSMTVEVTSPPDAEGTVGASAEISGSATQLWNTGDDLWQHGTTVTVDSVAPTNPEVSSPTHVVGGWGAWSRDRTVSVAWPAIGAEGAAADDLAGIGGYSVLWDTSATTVPTDELTHTDDTLEATSPPLADGKAHWLHLRAVDRAGNWAEPVHLGPFLIDGTDPAAPTIVPLPAISTSRVISLSWGESVDITSGVPSYQPSRRTSGWTKLAFGDWQADAVTTSLSKQITTTLGTTYCFKVRAQDRATNIADSAEQCTSIPLNDGALNRIGTWQTKTVSGVFADSSVSISSEQAAALQRADVTNAKRIGLVVTKCAGCGTVRVLLDGVPLERVGSTATVTSTGLPAGSAAKKRSLIRFKPFVTPHSGVLRVVVVSDGKPVHVEGVAASKL